MNMCAFNARSLRNKIEKTWKFLSENTIHLLAVSESWFGKSVPDSSVTIPGFQAPFFAKTEMKGEAECVCMCLIIFRVGAERISSDPTSNWYG